MKTLNVRDDNLDELFMHLQNHISGEMTRDQGEYSLKAHSLMFRGTFKGKCYSNTISFIKCSLHTKEELKFQIKSDHSPSFLYFIFCNRGSLMHRNGSQEAFKSIYQYQTAVISPDEQGLEFLIPKNLDPELIILKIHPKLYLRKEKFNFKLNQNLQNIYEKFDHQKGNAHYGNYNLKICDYFNEIDNIKEEGFIKNIMVEGRVKLLLAILIKQYKDDIKNRQKIKGLTSSELQRIIEVAEHIKINPSAPYSLKKLTKAFAISPSTLQKGFKILHNRTVADYIKNIRIEVAENMMKNRDCTISEIVYDIGFTSRSYFSKIFKEKYKCSPKHYQEKLKLPTFAL